MLFSLLLLPNRQKLLIWPAGGLFYGHWNCLYLGMQTMFCFSVSWSRIVHFWWETEEQKDWIMYVLIMAKGKKNRDNILYAKTLQGWGGGITLSPPLALLFKINPPCSIYREWFCVEKDLFQLSKAAFDIKWKSTCDCVLRSSFSLGLWSESKNVPGSKVIKWLYWARGHTLDDLCRVKAQIALSKHS